MLRIPLCDLLGIELQIIQKGKASVPHVLRRPRARGGLDDPVELCEN